MNLTTATNKALKLSREVFSLAPVDNAQTSELMRPYG